MKRDKKIEVRITEKELKIIKSSAEKSKMTVSEYIRKISLEQKKIFVFEGLDKLIKELNAVGNNLNQLTRLAHEGKINKVNLQEIDGIIIKLNNIFTKIYLMR